MKTDMIVKVRMDGQLTDEVAHFEYDGSGESKGVIDFGLKAVRPYRFEDIKTTSKCHILTRMQLYLRRCIISCTDDEGLARPGRVSAKLGTITVELFKIERWDECKARPRFDSKLVVNPRHVHVADSHKMGDRHAVGWVCQPIHGRYSADLWGRFGTRRSMREHPYCFSVYNPVGEEKTPFLIFHFKYRPYSRWPEYTCRQCISLTIFPAAALEDQGIIPHTIRATIARKRPPSLSLITNASKKSRDDSEGPTEIHDSHDESPRSSPSSGPESSGTSPAPESEEGVSEAPVIGQTDGDVTRPQQNTLLACKAAEVASIEVCHFVGNLPVVC